MIKEITYHIFNTNDKYMMAVIIIHDEKQGFNQNKNRILTEADFSLIEQWME